MDQARRATIGRRLLEGKLCLETLEMQRRVRSDPNFGKANEIRIINRELLDLELQEIDEQIERICAIKALIRQ